MYCLVFDDDGMRMVAHEPGAGLVANAAHRRAIARELRKRLRRCGSPPRMHFERGQALAHSEVA